MVRFPIRKDSLEEESFSTVNKGGTAPADRSAGAWFQSAPQLNEMSGLRMLESMQNEAIFD